MYVGFTLLCYDFLWPTLPFNSSLSAGMVSMLFAGLFLFQIEFTNDKP